MGRFSQIKGRVTLSPHVSELDLDIEPAGVVDFCHVKGQEHVKRALEVAAAGGHNVFMFGTKTSCILPFGVSGLVSN